MTLREEALQIVNDTPEYLLKALLYNLEDFKDRQFNSLKIEEINNGEVDPKKAAAFAALEELSVRNRKYLKGIDLEKEFLEAIDEKYGNPR